MIHLVHVRNPLLPAASREDRLVNAVASRSMAEYLEEFFGVACSDMVASLNGKIIPPDMRPGVIPRDGDFIVVTPLVRGGSTWRTLASIAVAAASITASVLLGPEFLALGFSAVASSALTAGAAAAISIGGNLLISTFMQLSPSSKNQTPSYAFQGPQSLAQSGTVIPKGYGTFRWGGNIIASFIDIEGADQYINCLVCFGFGPARNITDLQINNKDIYTYQNVQYYIRNGTNDQSQIPFFNRIVNGYPQEVEVTCAGGPVVVPGTGDLTQALQVDIEFPVGVFYITGDGNQVPCQVIYLVQYAISGTYDWQPILQPLATQDVVVYNSDGTVDTGATPTWGLAWTGGALGTGVMLETDNGPHIPGDVETVTQTIYTVDPTGHVTTSSQSFTGEWQPINYNLNQFTVSTWTNGYVRFVDSTTTSVYNRTSVYGLAPNKYDIQVTKYGSNNADNTVQEGDYDSPRRGEEVWIHSVNEITYQDLAYPNMILVGVRALATTQIAGANVNITAVVQHGLRTLDNNVLPTALQAFEEDNPACVAADMMLDDLYGGGSWPGILPTNIERFIDEWVDWANLNDELVNAQGNITALAIATPGSDQVPGNYTVAGVGGGGQGAEAVIVVGSGGTVTETPTITNPGEGYSSLPTFSLPYMAGATPATFTPTLSTISIRRHVFNGVLDDENNLWQQLNTVCMMSRAAIIPIGRDYGVFIDQEDTPVQMFTIGNIAQDSFQETWQALDERANQIEVQFADSTRYYRQDNPIVYMDPADMNAGVVIKNVRLNGKGITVPAQAWHFGHFKGLCNKLLLRTGTFQSDVEAIACRPGNLIILQHDVPQWGAGGRLLANNTTTTLYVDRDDLPWNGTSPYSVVVLHPSIQRYSGTVTSVSTDVDSSGLTIGTLVGVTSFDGANRVTRAVINNVDCAITASSPLSLLVQLPPGFTPAVGMVYALYDTDVLDTQPVANVVANPGKGSTVTLSSPLAAAPQDYGVYFYGAPNSQKIVRVTAIKRQSEFRAALEWIDYDPNAYVDGTPIVGETSAQITTSPGVTNLSAVEVFELLASSGSYADYASLNWTNGPNTAGVAIYGQFPGGTLKELTRLTGTPTQWRMQVSPGVDWTFTVVGFDANDNYAGFATAPSVSLTAVGITNNLLLGSTFQNGFAYWDVAPRAGDTLAFTLADEIYATYTVAGSALTAATRLLAQTISTTGWSVGTELMLSAYFACTGTMVGNLVADIEFYSNPTTVLSTARAVMVMAGASQGLTRVWCPLTAVPSGTVSIRVGIRVDGSSLNLPVGTILEFSHLLLEVGVSGQTEPSAWADIDAKGNVLDVFQGGASSSLRTQGSTVPTITGSLSFAYTATTVTISWASLVIAWPDGSFTQVQDGSIAITGLTASTAYYAYLYYDVINGGVQIVPTSGSGAAGSPSVLSTALNGNYQALCHQDGRVALTPNGLTVTTAATGGSGGGTGGGTGGGPITCTLRGTVLLTIDGPMSNDKVYELMQHGEHVYLKARRGFERIAAAYWCDVERYHWIEVEGFPGFGASESMTLVPADTRTHRWCSRIPSGRLVETTEGYRKMKRTLVVSRAQVLKIELDGPSHEYLAGIALDGGVWTHNYRPKTT